MDKYIIELIKLYSKVIFPDFGALTITDEESGEVMFNPYLNYGDHKLAERLEEESNMNLQEAKNAVAKFVRELKYHLDKGETYSIYQLGEFYKEKDEYFFSGNVITGKSSRVIEETPGFTPPIPPTTEEEIKTVHSLDDVLAGSPRAETPSIPASELKEEPIIEVETPRTETPRKPVVPNKNVYKETEEEKTEETKIEETKEEEPAVTPPIKEEKEKRKPIFGTIALLSFLLLIGLLFFFNKEKIDSFMGWDKFADVELVEETQESEVLPDEEVVQEEEVIEEAEEFEEDYLTEEELIEEEIIEEVEQPVQITPSTGEYHIIIGGFSEEANANKAIAQWKEHGFDSKIAKRNANGLYLVAAQSYPTMGDAQAGLAKVNEISSGAWILKE